ncbi:dentin sialophosphoprotein-like [Diaphorina citri]|uniref:Dentin sialophosphoprotein-like n=1 Tax=Diaphorina citri TaxID=121845 RepID=A0A3Q0IUP3_DIACI|nr:dentin sialophosphoprotein-like [Diaphorina citri]
MYGQSPGSHVNEFSSLNHHFTSTHSLYRSCSQPQNLVLTGEYPDCDVKLCDFGISRHLSRDVDVREILGTPDYVAPEVLNYEPISLATDMWFTMEEHTHPHLGVTSMDNSASQHSTSNSSDSEEPKDLSMNHHKTVKKLKPIPPPLDLSQSSQILDCKTSGGSASSSPSHTSASQKNLPFRKSDRLSAKQCLEHVWFSQVSSPSPPPAPHMVETNNTSHDVTSDVTTCNGDEPEHPLASEKQTECPANESTSTPVRAVSSPLVNRKLNNEEKKSEATAEDLSPIKTNNKEDTDQTASNKQDDSTSSKEKDNTPKGMNGERRRSFMKNMEDLVKKLEELDYDTNKNNKDDKEESNLRRATSMQTMPVPNLVRYKLDAKFSKNVVIDDDPLFKYKRLFIFDDMSDTSSPPSSNYGSMSSDNSSMSDSASDSISEMSLDSSSDRSSIISLDDTLDVMYSKNHRHYSSCYNVWEAYRNKTNTRVWPRECDGSFARALSRFTTTPVDPAKEGFHPLRNKNSLTIFKPAANGRKCIGLELMKERNGNIVVIREIKAINGSKYPRCSEVKCESLQSRIRRLQVQNGLRTELDKSSCQSNDMF